MKPLVFSVPGSKSMTQRALILAALSDGPTRIQGALWCDDSRVLTEVLTGLGVVVHWRDRTGVTIQPAPLRARGQTFDCHNGGTAVRFSACLSLLCEGAYVLDGNARMRERPLGPLLSALATLGVRSVPLMTPGFVPVRLERIGTGPDEIELPLHQSSQYLSGLLMVAPCLPQGLVLGWPGALVSRPYVEMTLAMMARAGVLATWTSEQSIAVPQGSYQNPEVAIEPDWSSASFLLAAGFLLRRPLQVQGLLPPGESLQGDAAFAEMLEELKQPHAHSFDLTQAPDLIAPLVAAALFARHPSHICGAAHVRIKESDRIAVLAGELSRLGARIEERPDGMLVHPLLDIPQGSFQLDPAGDHRMAMAFGILSLCIPGIEVQNPEVVDKSYPEFFETLASLRALGSGA